MVTVAMVTCSKTGGCRGQSGGTCFDSRRVNPAGYTANPFLVRCVISLRGDGHCNDLDFVITLHS